MAIQYKRLSTILNNEGLESPDLSILRQDEDLYTSLLYQPCGEIEWTNEYIRLAQQNVVEAKFNRFFALASEKNVDLAITPEYSCPWSTIEGLINDDLLPEQNKLWIIGCQSINAGRLNTLISDNPEIVWITENDKIQTNINNNRFFDPVCYIFKAPVRNSAEIKTVIIIQFKTQSLGGDPAALRWERNNFIRGEHIYILENDEDSTRLITLICSDALNNYVNIAQAPGFLNMPYLIVHIQLNQAPNNIVYCRYRGDIYGQTRENKEFICLNWARNVVLDNERFNEYGGSALYIKPEEDKHIDLTDDRLNQNQKLGLYYTKWSDRRAHIFLFNYDEHVFLYRTTKPSQELAPGQIQHRSGPEMLEAFHWNNNAWQNSVQLDSGFQTVCVQLNNGHNYASLLNYQINKPIDAERLVYLSVGNAVVQKWHEPSKVTFFVITDTEINNRITFAQNPCPVAMEMRRVLLRRYTRLAYSIVLNPQNWPVNISDLEGNCLVEYRIPPYEDEYSLNLFSSNPDGVPGSGAFIGHSSVVDAKDILAEMIKNFKDNRFGSRTVVWYTDENGSLFSEYDPDAPKFTGNTSISPVSFKSPKKK